MLVIFAVIAAGMLTGRLLAGRRLGFVQRLITVTIWALLFLLGAEVGADRAVVQGVATLGAAAFSIFGCSVAGSMLAAWLLWRYLRGRAAAGSGRTAEDAAKAAPAWAAAAPNAGNARNLANRDAGNLRNGNPARGIVHRMETAAAGNAGAARACEAATAEWAASAGSTGIVSSPESGDDVVAAGIAPARNTACAAVVGAAGNVRAAEETAAPRTAGTAENARFPENAPAARGSVYNEEDTAPACMWTALKGSLTIVAFFAAGCAAGLFVPWKVAAMGFSTYVLYTLMFCVGITLGSDRTLAERLRQLDPRLGLLPLATIAGTLAGAAAAAPLVAPWSLTDSLAVGAGFGYYSLSSLFIADFRGPELASVGLLCNVMREIFTLLCAPLVARWFGPLAAVSIGGATTFDTTLPVITRAAGRPYAVVSVFHGCAVDFSVPFLVTLFCTI